MPAIPQFTTTATDDSSSSEGSTSRYQTAPSTPIQVRIASDFHSVCRSFQKALIRRPGPPANVTLFANVPGWKIIVSNAAHHPKDFGDGVIHTNVPFTYSYQTYNGEDFWKLKIQVEPGIKVDRPVNKVIDITVYDEPFGYQFVSIIMKATYPEGLTWAQAAHDVIDGSDVMFGSFDNAIQQDEGFVPDDEDDDYRSKETPTIREEPSSEHQRVNPFFPFDADF